MKYIVHKNKILKKDNINRLIGGKDDRNKNRSSYRK